MNKIFLSLLFIIILVPGIIFAVDCPRGIVNEPAPGSCGLYIDTNKDGYCDLSELDEVVNYGEKTFSDGNVSENQAGNSVKVIDHKVGLITVLLIFSYLVGVMAVKNKIISLITHRKLWNWFLLVLFVPTAITSIFLALTIEFGVVINFGLDLSFWHFVFGWAFLVVSLFHFFWHISYYFRK